MNPYLAYQQTQTNTAPPGELVVMLYRGAIRFVGAALAGLEAHDVERAHANLIRTQAIVAELAGSLDVERGGEIARNLASIYAYLHQRLVEANLRKDPEPAREVDRWLRELLPAWEQASRLAGQVRVAA